MRRNLASNGQRGEENLPWASSLQESEVTCSLCHASRFVAYRRRASAYERRTPAKEKQEMGQGSYCLWKMKGSIDSSEPITFIPDNVKKNKRRNMFGPKLDIRKLQVQVNSTLGLGFYSGAPIDEHDHRHGSPGLCPAQR
jgi:hypothetical protein